jgi:hypothetical protein
MRITNNEIGKKYSFYYNTCDFSFLWKVFPLLIKILYEKISYVTEDNIVYTQRKKINRLLKTNEGKKSRKRIMCKWSVFNMYVICIRFC